MTTGRVERICITCEERPSGYGNGMCRRCWSADYYQKNKTHIRELERERRRRKSPEEKRAQNAKHREWRSEWRLKRYYNITKDDYDRMLEAQGGVCAICRQSCKSGKRLAVDHDHACCPGVESCGECVRGLLCYRCNSVLGFLDEDVKRVEAVMQYLTSGIEKLDKRGSK